MRSAHGPYIDKFFPEPYKNMLELTKTLRKIYPDVDLPTSLIELVNVRVSQINGCGTCLSLHVPAARRAGVQRRNSMLWQRGKWWMNSPWRKRQHYS